MGCGASASVPNVKGFYTIPDRYKSLEEVQTGLRQAGLESSNLIIAVDYTKSNTFNGEKTFGGRSLHWIDYEGQQRNPYEEVISIIGRTLEAFDDDQLIPVFGFGDVTTRDVSVFPFFRNKLCYTFQEVLSRYREITRHVDLGGPTNFGPVIRAAIELVKEKRSYHILVIVADGQVQRVKDTIDAIVDATAVPLSIIMIGVGDGPWDMMERFDDEIPERRFDNFQFVPFHDIVSRAEFPEASFATAALMEIPDQFKIIKGLGLLDI